MPAIGIDLGTTNSCVSVVKDGRAEIIINNNGKRTTPSVIGLWNYKEIVIGESAAKMAFKYPEGVISGVKYTFGKKINKESLANNTMLLNHDNKLKYSVKRGNAKEYYNPEELSAMVLMALKKFAQKDLDQNVTKAVITVPTYFDDFQREATIAAGKIAGFEEVKLLNESVAAAVAYGVVHKIKDSKIIFVFDFGGGTFDVSILKYTNNEFDVLSIDGDLNLGGDDITSLLFNYTIKKLNNDEIKNNKRFTSRILQLCEDAKISLSNQSEVFLDLLEHNEEIQISRQTFDELTSDLFDKLMGIVERCLQNAKLTINDIDDILLVGGSSRIPTIQNRIKEYFNKEPKQNINPDEVVAQGAAIVAANWDKSGFDYIKLNTISAHSIGIETYGKYMEIIIPKYSKLPVKKLSKALKPEKENQTEVHLQIYYGEDKYTVNNTYLGRLEVKNIAIDSNSIRSYNAIMELNEDSILKVTTVDTIKKISETTITLNKTNLNEVDIYNSFIKLSTQIIK